MELKGILARKIPFSIEFLGRGNQFDLELSVDEMYASEMLMPAMLIKLESLGFRLASLQEVYVDGKTGRVLQYDGLFLRQPNSV